jgi:hypothetical protein
MMQLEHNVKTAFLAMRPAARDDRPDKDCGHWIRVDKNENGCRYLIARLIPMLHPHNELIASTELQCTR